MPKSKLPREIELYHQPTDTIYLGFIVKLSSDLVGSGMLDAWWEDPDIQVSTEDSPIDRDWPWREVVADFEAARFAATTLLLAITMDHSDVQGAMCVDTHPRPSMSDPAERTIFIEAIATAPRNRPDLRTDKGQWLLGIGMQLLAWAVDASIDAGCGGRIELFASPKGISWYRKRGFSKIDVEKKNYDGVEYTPMVLTSDKAAAFKLSLSQER